MTPSIYSESFTMTVATVFPHVTNKHCYWLQTNKVTNKCVSKTQTAIREVHSPAGEGLLPR